MINLEETIKKIYTEAKDDEVAARALAVLMLDIQQSIFKQFIHALAEYNPKTLRQYKDLFEMILGTANFNIEQIEKTKEGYLEN